MTPAALLLLAPRRCCHIFDLVCHVGVALARLHWLPLPRPPLSPYEAISARSRGCASNEPHLLIVVFVFLLAVVLLDIGGTVLVGLVTAIILLGMM